MSRIYGSLLSISGKDEVKVWMKIEYGRLFLATEQMAGDLKGADWTRSRRPRTMLSGSPYKPGAGGDGPQCKCRSSDHIKEPGWHHEQSRWHQHWQGAQQLGANVEPPSFPFFSSLSAKLYPSQQRARIGWQGGFGLGSQPSLAWKCFEHVIAKNVGWACLKFSKQHLHFQSAMEIFLENDCPALSPFGNFQVNLCPWRPRPWRRCWLPEVQRLHGLLEKVSHSKAI